MTPSRTALESLLAGCGITLSPAQLDQLWAYHRMLRAANAELNLTRIHNFENMVLKHYVDSLLVLRFEPSLPSPLVDMGSGPGLPGIPLKIARPELPMILAEPRGARADFLARVCARLGFKDVEVFAGKVNARFPRLAGGVITRAVASIPETLDLVAGCLAPGGRMLFMKGPGCDDEIAETARTRGEAFRLVADHAYAIPGTPHERRLVVYERLDTAAPTDPHVPHAREVSSAANPTYKLGVDLLAGRGIRKHGKALMAGPRVVAEVVSRFPGHVEGWLTDAQGSPPPAAGVPWFRLADPLFRALDVSGTHSPLLLVRVPAMPVWSDEHEWPPGCTLFVPFQDPENVGAVIRSAAAFGAARVVLLKGTAHPFHPRSVRAAGPSLFQVPLFEGPALGELTCGTVPLIALDTEGPALGEDPFPERFGLVIGVEGPGLPAHLRAGPRRRIAMAAGVESLNAATAAAITLYAWRSALGRQTP